jgi:hypothetical protein
MFFKMPKSPTPSEFLATLYPHLSPQEQREAEENLRRYLSIVRRIFEQARANNPQLLTELRRRATVRKRRAHK